MNRRGERVNHTIRRELGWDATFLAWPFGYRSARVDSIAREVGFRRTFTLVPRRNSGDPPGSLGRYAVTARTSSRVFRLMLEPHAGREAGESAGPG